MSVGSNSGDDGAGDDVRPSLGERWRYRQFRQKTPIAERVRDTFLKPGADLDSPPPGVAAGTPDSVPELEALVKQANDKERLIGVLAAPVAAAIATIYTFHSINQDPAQFLADGADNPKYVSLSLYHELLVVMLGLSLLMMVMAMLRKRLFLGMVMALYGLAMFNLHGYGFAIPFLMGGSWLMVRAYRLQRSLREATDPTATRPGYGRTSSVSPRPGSNKRYTPPSARSRRRPNQV